MNNNPFDDSHENGEEEEEQLILDKSVLPQAEVIAIPSSVTPVSKTVSSSSSSSTSSKRKQPELSSITAYAAEDVENAVLEEANRQLVKEDQKKLENLETQLATIRSEIQKVDELLEGKLNKFDLSASEAVQKDLKTKRKKELQGKEKLVLSSIKRMQTQIKETLEALAKDPRLRSSASKNKGSVSIAAEETEKDRLVRTGLMTPFGKDTTVVRRHNQQNISNSTATSSSSSANTFANINDTTGLKKLEKKRKASAISREDKKVIHSHDTTQDDGNDTLFEQRLETIKKRRISSDSEEDNSEKKVGDNEEEFVEFDSGLKCPASIYDNLFEYQKTGMKWLWELHTRQVGGIVGDEMGLGKTVQIVSFLAALHYSKLFKPSIIICPGTVMKQWVKEFHEWYPAFRCIIFHNSTSAVEDTKVSLVAKAAKSKNGILITTYESVRIYQDILVDHEWGYIILDEGHKIRNPDASITISCKKFETPHRIILTGTPIQNNLKELWSLFDFCYPGKLGTLPVFQSQFGVPISLGGYANATALQVSTAYKCAVILRDLISPYLLRRMKRDVQSQLPPKSEQVLFCKLTDEQVKVYQEYLDQVELDKVMETKTILFRTVTLLRQICNHPDIVDKDKLPKKRKPVPMAEFNYEDFEDEEAAFYNGTIFAEEEEESVEELIATDENYGAVEKSGKLKVVETLLKLWKEEQHRVLLYSQSRKMLDILEKLVRQLGYKHLRMDGTTSMKDRIPMIDSFNEDESYYCFLATTKTGGIGVNLCGADRIILYDPDWNPSTDIQALERAWRVGQTRPVTVYRLMTSGTIEEKMYHRQIFKQFLSNKILKDPRQRRFFKSNDLHELFKLGNEYSHLVQSKSNLSRTNLNGNAATETGNLFGSETRASDLYRSEEFKQTGEKENTDDNDDKSSESDGDGETKNETSVLKALFDSNDIKSALNHDEIINSANVERSIVEHEASLIAKKAAEEIRRSIASNPRNSVGSVTWTGKNGNVGLPKKFGQNSSSSSSISSQHLIDRLKGNMVSSSSSTNNNASLNENNNTMEFQMMKRIVNFFKGKNGKVNSEQLVTNFKTDAEGEAAFLFRQCLKELAYRENGFWYLKEEFK